MPTRTASASTPTPVPSTSAATAKLGGVAYTMVRADHSTGMHGQAYKDGTVYAEPDGSVCGFVLTFDDGPVIYDTADTGVFGDMALISQLYAPDLVIMPAGGKYTMGVKEAAMAAALTRPRAVIPCHYDTFPNQAADIDDLRRRIADPHPAHGGNRAQAGRRRQLPIDTPR